VLSENRGFASDGSGNADDIDIKRDAPRRRKSSFKSILIPLKNPLFTKIRDEENH
jgi:hypothetical protein